ncbi:MAG: metal-sulfur cluster biosynthetic enzyme [Draconibacterium sp.]|nr:metal-sulfur cluster biosynthetic enzyme [Draconibacterium sp.]
MQTIENVINEISKVNHPAISYSLTKLGIVKDIELNDDTIILTFPFPDIPIADRLISSISEPVEAMGLKLEYIVKTMNEEEKATFLKLEGEAWKGL